MVKDAEPSRVSSTVAPPQVGPSEIFKALGDPVRWSIICQIAEVSELGCSVLEDTLSVSKPTISYHTKILIQAGLLDVRKEGRNFYYTLRRDVLRALVDDVWALAPEPRPVRDGTATFRASSAVSRKRWRSDGAVAEVANGSRADGEAVLLTW
jgi:DNA-binding transcriptional ArsR family regulator